MHFGKNERNSSNKTNADDDSDDDSNLFVDALRFPFKRNFQSLASSSTSSLELVSTHESIYRLRHRKKKKVKFDEIVRKRLFDTDEAIHAWISETKDSVETIHFQPTTDMNVYAIPEEGYFLDDFRYFNPSFLALMPGLAGIYALVLALIKTEWVITTIEVASGLRV